MSEEEDESSRKRIRSSIWDNFTKSREGDDVIAQCNMCSTSYKNPSGTSNLWKHYNSTHKPKDVSQGTIGNNGRLIQVQPMSADVAEKYTAQIAAFVIDASLPFMVVENCEFVKLMKMAIPRYDPPTRKVLKDRIIGQVVTIRARMKEIINADADSKFSFTLDGWSSRIYQSYFAFTAHWVDKEWNMQSVILEFVRFETAHTGLNVKYLILDILEDWDLKESFLAITSDNGSEMILGLELVGSVINRGGFHIRCMAHVMNLAVKDAFDRIKKSIKNLRDLIKAIRTSVKRRERFHALKQSLDVPDAKFPGLDVKTRWSSTYLMLTKAIEARPLLNAMCCEDKELADFMLTPEEWETAKKLCELLSVFHNATQNQSGKLYVSLSMTSRIFDMLYSAVQEFKERETNVLQEIGTVMEAKLGQYMGLVSNNLTRIAQILDPRFANTDPTDEELLRTAMNDSGYEVREAESTPSQEPSSFLTFVFGTETDANGTILEMDEIQLLLHCTKIKESAGTDPLVWWKLNEQKFPSIAQLAKDIFAVQASSVASESAFSIAGRVVDETRTRLSDESIQALMLLQSWTRYLRANAPN